MITLIFYIDSTDFSLSAYINIRHFEGGFCLWSGYLQWVDGGINPIS